MNAPAITMPEGECTCEHDHDDECTCEHDSEGECSCDHEHMMNRSTKPLNEDQTLNSVATASLAQK